MEATLQPATCAMWGMSIEAEWQEDWAEIDHLCQLWKGRRDGTEQMTQKLT